jgi:nuclear cap-binding protein subunit 1
LVKIEDAIQGVATDFVAIFDTEEYRTGYLDCLHDVYVVSSEGTFAGTDRDNSVVEQPFKIPFVATVVRVANVDKEEIGKAVVNHFTTALNKFLALGAFTQIKLVLRFFACLGDMIGESGVLPLLEQLIAKLPDYQKEGDEVRCSEYK